MTEPTRDTLHKVHAVKRELFLFRRAMWPMRDLIKQIQRERHECLSEMTQTYFRDVYDHCIQMIDLVETYREIAGAVTETYMSTISNRTNDVMRVLTVIGTIFIPLTFLSGVYGMNMGHSGDSLARSVRGVLACLFDLVRRDDRLVPAAKMALTKNRTGVPVGHASAHHGSLELHRAVRPFSCLAGKVNQERVFLSGRKLSFLQSFWLGRVAGSHQIQLDRDSLSG